MATAEAAKIGLVASEDVVDACVVRQAKAYPIYDDLYRERMGEIRRDIEANYPTLHLVGRNGMHKYNNQDHAMMTAILTARNILAGERLYDVWSVNEDAQYQESDEAECAGQRAIGAAQDRLVSFGARSPVVGSAAGAASCSLPPCSGPSLRPVAASEDPRQTGSRGRHD